MIRILRSVRLTAMIVALTFAGASLVSAQTFTSGSTGALGALAPAANTTVTLPADGILNYTTVTIPSGVTVTFTRNAANTPVTMLATGNVTITGAISVKGDTGLPPLTSGPGFNVGALGGPGGFNGGNGGARGGGSVGAAGLGPGGGAPAAVGSQGAPGGTYAAPDSFVSLLPLYGGSGGGGGQSTTIPANFSGGSGAGGGGAIVIASSTTITVTGTIDASGGVISPAATSCFQARPGAGSGGAIRLVAPQVVGTGTLTAAGSNSGCSSLLSSGPGRIRLEGFTLNFTGTSTPAFSPSMAPGPVTAASIPALVNLPTVSFTVGGVAAPSTPGGSYAVADIALPPTTTNPVPTMLTATNLPTGTVFTVRLVPQFGAATSVNTPPTAGTFATSTTTVNLTFPTGEVSVLNATGSFTLPQLAGLFPLIDGDPAEQVLLAAGYGEPSTLTLVTKSGKEVPVSRLSQTDQRKVAMAFEAMWHESR